MKRIYKLMILSVAAFSLATGCNKEEIVDPYSINYVYIYNPVTTSYNLSYYGDGSFKRSIEEEISLVPVRCTKPAPADIKVNFTIDKSLVDTYNAANGTAYTFLESASLKNQSLTIQKGKYISADSVGVAFTDLKEFQSGTKNYLLPVTISEVYANGIALSESRVIYLSFTSELIVLEEANEAEGNLLDTSGWTVSDTDGDNITDLANQAVVWYHWDGDFSFYIDCGKKEKIKSVVFNWYYWYYAASGVTFSVSEDGSSWEALQSELQMQQKENATNIIVFPASLETQHLQITFSGAQYEYDDWYYPYIKGMLFYGAE